MLNLNNEFVSRSSYRLKHALSLLALVITLSSLSGCVSSSQLTNMWRDSSYDLGPMTNVLIVALNKDAVRRRLWEDGFAAELVKHGVTATPSYRIYPDAPPDTAQVVETVRRDNYDGVLVARRLPPETQTEYVEGYTTKEPVTRYNRWTNIYYTYYREVNHPGYAETTKIARHEINVWTTKERGRLVWAGTGEVLDPSSSPDIKAEITKLIVPELAKQGIVPAKQK